MSKTKKLGIILSVILLGLDQLSKYFVLVFHQKFGYYSYSVIGEYLKLTFAKNYGAAFSFRFFNSPKVSNYSFTILTILAVIFIIYLVVKSQKRIEIFAYFLIIAGALGNLFDRILQGFVIDFIDCDFPDIILQRWPVFNFADSYICIAIGLFIIQALKVKNEKENS